MIAMTAAGCATAPPASDPDAVAEYKAANDPLEPTNRAIFAFNDAIDTAVLRPVAEGYRYVVPAFGRARVRDFLSNLGSPLVLANDVLQGNLRKASTTVGRFALNTTFGVLGIMDVASQVGLQKHDADVGETLAIWGVGEGPYLVLPILGPSNPRDAIGSVGEIVVDPVGIYLSERHLRWLEWTRLGVSVVSEREAYLDELDDVKRSSLDYYTAMRSLYRQRRASLISSAGGPADAQNSPDSTNQSQPK